MPEHAPQAGERPSRSGPDIGVSTRTTNGFLTVNSHEMYAEDARPHNIAREDDVSAESAPVLLLHGGFCSLESLRPQADALAEEHRVLAFERPGHGRSADIPGGFDYDRGVDDALAYLDAMGVAQAHLVGYSDGAIIGLLLAMRHPQRVRSLVAISANLDPSAFDMGDEEDSSPEPEPSPERATEPEQPTVEPGSERDWYQRLSPDGPEHVDVVLDKLMALWRTEPHIAATDLGAVAAPTLVMAADRDAVPVEHTLLIARSIPNAQLCIVPGATHALVAERPELISTIIGDFLRGR
ncbi:alpha/beta fold hydrolase [Pseudoclavibacter sp. 13-3]|uniref:alpha/beta fold hydrolase n=1 Tax=Pseudoclavibacter sp. 13-3 TaxID=2901228 RepID=UPI001E2E0746|nr:alpha/beta hydrolase [Pseudoclavibacter sp. 13-3]MCD7101693.1 alpha/beta hydrolase [Pseudoclavibacter sp. 13-3]